MSNPTETPDLHHNGTPYRRLTQNGVHVETFRGQEVLIIEADALEQLAFEAFHDSAFFLRATHTRQVSAILSDPEASDNDRFVARALLENAVVSARGELPFCQDTGTAIVVGTRGQQVWTEYDETAALTEGIRRAYAELNLRYSQIAPLTMFEEHNTGTNLPAQIDLQSGLGMEYEFLFIAKGGGSANKSLLYQQTKSLLNEAALAAFIEAELPKLGTAACPPYHLAVVIGGTSAEATMKQIKLASAGALDHLPTRGDASGRAFRDLEWEARILKMAQACGIGAQFGGKHFCHDVRVIRLPRHAASCPVGIGVSCSADRNIKARITRDGVFLEMLEHNPARYLPTGKTEPDNAPKIDLDRPMSEILAELSQYPVRTRLRLNGTLIVARDAAHARIQTMLDNGEPMPDYFKNHPIYYAGPAKTPPGKPSGSFGPTTAQRMDPYVDNFQALGGSMIMVAKGNRGTIVREACARHGGFYLGSIGGPAALLAEKNIRSVETIAFNDLGMEAIRKIRVVDFPAIILIDDKGNDFFE